MWIQVKLFLSALVLTPVLDYLWLGHVMNGYYKRELGSLARTEGGQLKPLLLPALVVYLLIALGIVVFVLARAENWAEALGYGALLGLVLYGVYDMTNLAVTAGYPLNLSLVDMAWGTFICAIVSLLTFLLKTWLTA